MVVKKCNKCGALIKVLKDCECSNCGFKCCDEEMFKVEPNVVEASLEKHLPTYNIVDDKIVVKVNHVMEEEHYIEWIVYECDNNEQIVYFKPGEEATATFKYSKGAIIYSYCNKHSLWSVKV